MGLQLSLQRASNGPLGILVLERPSPHQRTAASRVVHSLVRILCLLPALPMHRCLLPPVQSQASLPPQQLSTLFSFLPDRDSQGGFRFWTLLHSELITVAM